MYTATNGLPVTSTLANGSPQRNVRAALGAVMAVAFVTTLLGITSGQVSAEPALDWVQRALALPAVPSISGHLDIATSGQFSQLIGQAR